MRVDLEKIRDSNSLVLAYRPTGAIHAGPIDFLHFPIEREMLYWFRGIDLAERPRCVFEGGLSSLESYNSIELRLR
jgi:hypothetical protein